MTPEISKQSRPLDSVLEQAVKDIGIPPRPIIIDRIAIELKQESPNFKHIGKLVSADVSLSASFIKTANSAYFGARTRVRTVDEALMRLGLVVTIRAITGISLRKAFPSNIQLDRFWNASAQIAALSGWLAQTVVKPNVRPDDAYTYGLFRDCGIPVLLLRFPDYQKTLACANVEEQRSFTEVEHLSTPTDHAMIGCLLAQNWWLPEEICLAIRHHHDLHSLEMSGNSLPVSSRNLIAVSQTAEYILQQLTGASRTCEWPKLGSACLNVLGIDECDLGSICNAASAVLKDVE